MCTYDMKFYRRRRVLVWVLIALAIIGALTFIGLSIFEYKIGNAKAANGMNGLAVFLLLGGMVMYAPHYFHWCGRFIGGTIFILYLLYLINEIIDGHFAVGRRSDTNVFNASMGLLVFGIPGLLYSIRAVRGKNPYRRDGSLRKPLLKEFSNDAKWPEEVDG